MCRPHSILIGIFFGTSFGQSIVIARRTTLCVLAVAEGFPKPLYDAVVEISFDSFEDFNTFFNSENYLTKVHPDEPNFFDTTNYIAMANNETIIKAGA